MNAPTSTLRKLIRKAKPTNEKNEMEELTALYDRWQRLIFNERHTSPNALEAQHAYETAYKKYWDPRTTTHGQTKNWYERLCDDYAKEMGVDRSTLK